MAKRLLTSIVSLGFLSSVLLASPAQADAANLKGAGSSYANKFITTCAVNDSATAVTYNPGGSGSGRTAFANGTVDFGASDAASSITSWSGSRAGYTSSKFSYIPIVGGPIAVLYQIPGITTGQLRLDSLTIAKIYSGKITKWNDPAIAALQTSAVKSKLPSNPIRVVYRSASSGTSENFTDYLRQTAPTVWTKAKNTTIASGNPAGKMPAGSIGGANSQALVSSVKSTKYSIGYADLSDAFSSKVPFATIKNANGEWVAPTVAASSKFLESFSGASGFNASTGAVTLNFTKKIAGAYNLSLVTYALADKGSTSAKAAEVEAFVKYMINTCGPNKAASIGYSPITGNLKTKALALAEAIS